EDLLLRRKEANWLAIRCLTERAGRDADVVRREVLELFRARCLGLVQARARRGAGGLCGQVVRKQGLRADVAAVGPGAEGVFERAKRRWRPGGPDRRGRSDAL